MQLADSLAPQQFEALYAAYAKAAQAYGQRPTLFNWEAKEKAFENYNALLKILKELKARR